MAQPAMAWDGSNASPGAFQAVAAASSGVSLIALLLMGFSQDWGSVAQPVVRAGDFGTLGAAVGLAIDLGHL